MAPSHDNGQSTSSLFADPFASRFRTTDGFDLSSCELPEQLILGTTLRSPVPRSGTFIETFPFPESFNQLLPENPDHRPYLERIHSLIETLTEFGVLSGIKASNIKWILMETVQNATQYGGTELHPNRCTLFNLSWEFERGESGPELKLAIVNPCRALFDPSRYLMMSLEDLFSQISEDGCNGHLGTTSVLGFAGRLEYAWHLANGDRILFAMEKMSDEQITRTPGMDLVNAPVVRTVARFDSQDALRPYSLDQFLADVRQESPAKSVALILKLRAETETQRQNL